MTVEPLNAGLYVNLNLRLWRKSGPNRIVVSDREWSKPLKLVEVARTNRFRLKVAVEASPDLFEDFHGKFFTASGRAVGTADEGLSWLEARHLGPAGARPITAYDIRRRLARMIRDTPNLDWYLGTKIDPVFEPREFTHFMWADDSEQPTNWALCRIR